MNHLLFQLHSPSVCYGGVVTTSAGRRDHRSGAVIFLMLVIGATGSDAAAKIMEFFFFTRNSFRSDSRGPAASPPGAELLLVPTGEEIRVIFKEDLVFGNTTSFVDRGRQNQLKQKFLVVALRVEYNLNCCCVSSSCGARSSASPGPHWGGELELFLRGIFFFLNATSFVHRARQNQQQKGSSS